MSVSENTQPRDKLSRWLSIAAVLIALCSMILEPVRDWLKEPRLKYDVGSVAWMCFANGNLQLNFVVSASNIGDAPARLETVEAFLISRDNKEGRWKLPAQNVIDAAAYSQVTTPSGIAFTPNFVQPGQTYKSTIYCFKTLSKDAEKRVDELAFGVEQEQGTAKPDNNFETTMPAWWRARMREEFEPKMQLLGTGEYHLLVEFTRDGGLKESQLFKLTVYDTDKKILHNILNEYDFGRGFNERSPRYFRCVSQHTLERVTDALEIDRAIRTAGSYQ